MALSDTCNDTLDTLQNDIVSYSEFNYNISELNKLFNAMFEMASFSVKHAYPFAMFDNKRNIFTGNLVIYGLLDKTSSENINSVLSIISEVAKINSRLSETLIEMLNYLHQSETVVDVDKYNVLIKQLTEILRLKNI